MSDFSKILTPWEGYDPAFQPGIMFTVAYLLCVAIVVLDVKHHRYAKHAMLRSFLTFQLCLDGITALMMGLGIYLQSNLIMGLAILLSCKFFLLSLLRYYVCMYGMYCRSVPYFSACMYVC